MKILTYLIGTLGVMNAVSIGKQKTATFSWNDKNGTKGVHIKLNINIDNTGAMNNKTNGTSGGSTSGGGGTPAKKTEDKEDDDMDNKYRLLYVDTEKPSITTAWNDAASRAKADFSVWRIDERKTNCYSLG